MARQKKKRILLRSNNDYIDHEYWPKIRAESKKRDKRMMEKYGVDLKNLPPHQYTDMEKKELKKQGIGVRHEVPNTEIQRRIPIVED